MCTEQNPAALGHTVSDIDTSHAAAIISKTTFSMLTPELKNKIDELGGSKIDSIVIFGLEVSLYTFSACRNSEFHDFIPLLDPYLC